MSNCSAVPFSRVEGPHNFCLNLVQNSSFPLSLSMQYMAVQSMPPANDEIT